MTAEICTMSMFLNKAEFEAAKAAAKSCACMQCKAERHDYMKGALEEIKHLLSAQANDGKSEAVKESNANQAWHRAYTTLNAIDPTGPSTVTSQDYSPQGE